MKPKARARLEAAVAPLLEQGEMLELGGVATIKRVTVTRAVATIAVSLIATGGMVAVHAHAKGFWIALTDRRLLVLEATDALGRPTSNVVLSVPRHLVRLARVKAHLMLKLELQLLGEEQGMRLAFPLPYRKDGRQFAAALGGPAA